MIVSLIVAMDERRGIGIANQLPWRQSADLRRFKALTMGHHLIMGRKTYESISRPLPGRTSIVVTRNPAYRAEGCLVAHSLEEALELARSRGETEAFVIGGSQIFSQAIGITDRIYLTRVHTSGEADVYFPEFREGDWETIEVSRHPANEKNEHPYSFMVLQKQTGAEQGGW